MSGSLFVPLSPHLFAVAFASVAAVGCHHLRFGRNDKAKMLVVFMIIGFSDCLKQQIAACRIAGLPSVAKHALSAVEKNGRRRIGHRGLDRRIVSQVFIQRQCVIPSRAGPVVSRPFGVGFEGLHVGGVPRPHHDFGKRRRTVQRRFAVFVVSRCHV